MKLPSTSDQYEIDIINYPDFIELYRSIHDTVPSNKVPVYRVTGAINLKDPDIPGYVPFALPKIYVNHQNRNFTLADLLANAVHERFERFLHKETILSKIFESAREDYHEMYTLSKEKNVTAFLLYYLSQKLIPIHETITYAMTYLIEDFLEANYPRLNQIHMPLIEQEFNDEEIGATENYMRTQFKGAYINKTSPEIAERRIIAGLKVFSTVTEKFQDLLSNFLELYPQMKSKFKEHIDDFQLMIGNTIQETFQKNGLADLLLLFDQEFSNL